MIFRSPLPEVEIPDLPLTDYVLARAEELGDKPALIDGPSGRTLTYGALLQGIRALAGGLVARGFEPGQALALLSPNLPEYAVVFHGVAYAGGVVTTINPTYVEREIHHQLLDADARLLVTIAPFLEVARAAVVGTAVEEIFVIGDTGDTGARSLTELMGEPLAEQVPVDLRRDRRAALLLRHDRCLQGRDADPPQPGRQRGADAGRRRPARGRDDRRRAAVLPHLRHAGADELRTARGRHDRHAAALRPRAVPLGPPGVRRHPVVRRPADRGGDGQAPARRQATTCPSSSRSSRARRRCRPSSLWRPGSASAARWSRATA